MSLLTVANDVCDIIGIERQVAIAAGTGGDARQLFRLCKQELSELARRTSWQALSSINVFTATATTIQPDGYPDDFMFMVPETFFNRTQNREVYGPLPAREWNLLSANPAFSEVQEMFRIRASTMQIIPAPTAGDIYSFEYVSVYHAVAGDDPLAIKLTYLVDTDLSRIDEELIKLGVVWRWKNLKGLDYAEDFRSYEMQVANSIARDGGKRTISMDGSRPPGVPVVGIPAGNWTP